MRAGLVNVFWATGLLGALAGCSEAAPERAKAASTPILEAPVVRDADPVAPEARRVVYVALEGPSAIEAVPRDVDLHGPAGTAMLRARLAALSTDHAALRGQLEALGAEVIADVRRVANVLQVVVPDEASLDHVRRLPGVAFVERVPIHHQTLGRSLAVVGAPAAWASPLTGQGTRIGIIDSGIDYLHASFDGPGTAAAYQANDRTVVELGSFPTARVVGGYDFAGDAYNPSAGAVSPSPDDDPLDCGGHGSHVAGIAGGGGVLGGGAPYTGPYDQSFDATKFQVGPGVAPQADLYAIKIFGCNGSTQLLLSALEYAADPDEDGDLSDRLDVVNASLGTSFAITSAVNGEAVTNLHAAGTLLVASAGNSGATFFATSSPAHFPEALSVAASYAGGFVTLEVSGATSGSFAAAEAAFSAPLVQTGPVVADVVAAAPIDACSTLSNGAAVDGQIAYVERGGCTFVEKFQRAEAAGAVGVILANDDFDSGLFTMVGDGTSSLPGVMISAADGAALAPAIGGGGVSAILSNAIFGGEGAELMAGLSARGPSLGDARLKPEIAAPGLGIDSVDVGSGDGLDDKSGTSMSSPFVAGAAALVRQAHPGWSPSAVKEALMASASPLVNGNADTYAASMQGAGRLDVPKAIAQDVTLHATSDAEAVALSFGAIVVDTETSVTAGFTVENRRGSPVSLQLAAIQILPLAGVTVEVEPATLEIDGDASAKGTVTLTVDPEALGDPGPDAVTPPQQFDLPRHWLNEADGWITVDGDAQAVLPFHAVVRAAAQRHAGVSAGCGGEGQIGQLEVTGTSAHPNPVVTALELGVVDPAAAGSVDPAVDIRALGAASNVATAESFDDATVFFGIAVAGTWNTPAVPGIPRVAVEVDVDDDGNGDVFVIPEPLGAQEPYADVLAATSYRLQGCNFLDVEGCAQNESKRYLNALPADVAPTHPYFNGVVVLPIFAGELGLTPESPRLRYRAVTIDGTSVAEVSDWASFDAGMPRLDTVKRVGDDNVPLYQGNESVVVHRGPGSEEAQLLLLHHANIEADADGEALRYEVVALDGAADPTVLAVEAPAEVAGAERFSTSVTVTNGASVELAGAEVTVTVTGGVLMAVSGAPCVGEVCTLSIPAGGSATLTVDAMAEADAGEAVVEAVLSTPEGCTQARSGVTAVGATPDPMANVAEAPFIAAGGCGCRTTAPAPRQTPWFLAFAALGLARVRREAGARNRAVHPAQ